MARIERPTASDIATRPSTGAQPARAAEPAGSVQADELKLSTGAKLLEGNKRALKHAGAALLQMVSHPLQTIGGVFTGMAAMIRHPGLAVRNVVEAFKRNPVDGVLQAGMVASAWGSLASIGLMAVAYGGALVTGGASLMLLPAAGVVAAVAGTVGVVGMVGSFVKNQVDVATADTTAELEAESQELGRDLANFGVMAVTVGAAKALGSVAAKVKPKNVNPSAAQRAATRVKGQIQKKLHHDVDGPPVGGVKVDGRSRDAFREMARQDVEVAVRKSVQHRRPLEVNDLELGSFQGVERLGDHRMVYHGTRSGVSHLVRKNGLKSSEIGDYGSGLYLGSAAKTGVNYADDVTLGRSFSIGERPVVYVGELAPGKVLDFFHHKEAFLKWAKGRFDPTDMTNPVNKLYADPSVPVSKMVDNTWTRFLPDFCKEMGYDSILVRDWDGPGLDYWVVHDPRRLVLRQEILIGEPTNRFLIPAQWNGRLAAMWQALTGQPQKAEP